MGISRGLKDVVLFGMGALVAGGVTYFATQPDMESCQQLQRQELQGIVEQYQDVPATQGVAGQEIEFKYIVSQDPEFKGLAWEDTQSGNQGVVTRQNIIGQITYGMQKADLSVLLNPVASVPVQPEIKILKR